MQNRRNPPAAGEEERRAVADRLHQAVLAAGGNRVVAERSGVPLGTLNNYVGARTGMKLGALAKLAAACDVSLEWVVSGDRPGPAHRDAGDIRPFAAARAQFSEPSASLAPPVLATGIDTAMLSKAIEIVAAMDGGAGLQGEPQILARRIAAAYAVLIKPFGN